MREQKYYCMLTFSWRCCTVNNLEKRFSRGGTFLSHIGGIEKMGLLERLLDMEDEELLDYIKIESQKLGLDPEEYEYLDGLGVTRQELSDFIADHIHPELTEHLHSECEWGAGMGMFPEAEDLEDFEEAMEHDFPGEDDF